MYCDRNITKDELITISSTFGKNLKITVFGGSHEPQIGVTICGLPEGISIDFEKMNQFMSRRAPGKNIYTTPRKESDIPIVESGLKDGKTTSDPLTIIIKNTNTRTEDYTTLKEVPRPSHADYTASVKYGKKVNMSGGGPFSARMTAPLCIAGAIALQLLEEQDIFIGAHIYSIGNVQDIPFNPTKVNKSHFKDLKEKVFPVLDDTKGYAMGDVIESAMSQGDSVGGIIECCAVGLPAGVGGPMYDSMEGHLSQIFFGIPAVKGIEFGNGFQCTTLRGSQNNDPFVIEDNSVKTTTNNHGGILGGISSGMPIICRLALKPTPSISMEQNSVNLINKTNEKFIIKGRHDPCVVIRAVPVVEAAMAIGLLDLLLSN